MLHCLLLLLHSQRLLLLLVLLLLPHLRHSRSSHGQALHLKPVEQIRRTCFLGDIVLLQHLGQVLAEDLTA